jgi:hypothetical protein
MYCSGRLAALNTKGARLLVSKYCSAAVPSPSPHQPYAYTMVHTQKESGPVRHTSLLSRAPSQLPTRSQPLPLQWPTHRTRRQGRGRLPAAAAVHLEQTVTPPLTHHLAEQHGTAAKRV